MAVYVRCAFVVYFSKQKFTGMKHAGKNVGLPLGGAVSA